MIGQQVVDRNPVLCPVAFHLVADCKDRLFEFAISLRQSKLLLQEVIADARQLVLVGERDEGRVSLLKRDSAVTSRCLQMLSHQRSEHIS